jgi:ABC-type phosphate transport system substrate-binding protein
VLAPAGALVLVALTAESAFMAVPRRVEGPLAVVVHRSNPVDELSLAELRSIFLGERQRWPNGRRITLVLQEPGQPEREATLGLVYHMSEAELNHHFLRAVYRGQVLSAPKQLSSTNLVRRFVFNLPGAIACLPLRDVDDSLKVLRIEGHAPAQPGYPLRAP